ncbi:dienelactone hydrolase [Parvibaculum lavamentivorans DS-1]|uniref:Dienelactone hydrolase n=1 Tax=Parvibaculum lavamentivorans (strain DS-1 / DSM 13023 / NCIMB 13966) TaxID=402881 RepID=A7HVD3_PARL1|nr:dienelactone hydrolase family protein [Parvibaculum lavamentivorans]ABS63866.1 dienelactone hydrolase [Parvibaculum lavamentivorans DS-1]
MAHKGKTITLKSGDGADILCYHVKAEGTRPNGKKAGLVLIMEIFGVTDHIKDLCDEYAARGYDVLAPQLYDRHVKDFQATYEQADIQKSLELRAKNPYENTVLDAQMCIDKLRADGCEKVFITGYCYGGTVSWVAACRASGLDAASCYYGGAIKDFIGETPKCPTICHFGEKDHGIPMEDVRRIDAAHPEVKVYVYDADHGFNSDRRNNYDKASAELALERTLALFDGA